jgi:hypothetical protein
VPFLRGGFFAELAQTQSAVLAERFQQPVARRVAPELAFEYGFLYQRPEQADDLARRKPGVRADRGRGFGVKPPGEDRQPGPQQPLLFAEQAVAPADGGLQCLRAT